MANRSVDEPQACESFGFGVAVTGVSSNASELIPHRDIGEAHPLDGGVRVRYYIVRTADEAGRAAARHAEGSRFTLPERSAKTERER